MTQIWLFWTKCDDEMVSEIQKKTQICFTEKESIHWIVILLGNFHMNRESAIRENRWIVTSLPFCDFVLIRRAVTIHDYDSMSLFFALFKESWVVYSIFKRSFQTIQNELTHFFMQHTAWEVAWCSLITIKFWIELIKNLI